MEFQIRPFELADAPSLARQANNPNIAANLMDRFPHPYFEENARAFIEMARGMKPVSVFGIFIGNEVAGGIGLHPEGDVYRLNAELGYWVAEPFWGRGIASRAVGQVVKWGFEHMDIDRIFARPFGSNVASQKVLEKAGFKLEARFEKTFIKNGRREDELVYAVRRSV